MEQDKKFLEELKKESESFKYGSRIELWDIIGTIENLIHEVENLKDEIMELREDYE